VGGRGGPVKRGGCIGRLITYREIFFSSREYTLFLMGKRVIKRNKGRPEEPGGGGRAEGVIRREPAAVPKGHRVKTKKRY